MSWTIRKHFYRFHIDFHRMAVYELGLAFTFVLTASTWNYQPSPSNHLLSPDPTNLHLLLLCSHLTLPTFTFYSYPTPLYPTNLQHFALVVVVGRGCRNETGWRSSCLGLWDRGRGWECPASPQCPQTALLSGAPPPPLPREQSQQSL